FYFWRAVIKATNAEHQDGLTALNAIRDARNLLLKAIDITPDAMNGSAYTTLGTLYYLAPGWPLAFGDTDKAEALLKTALKINPLGIDTNYYYGDFLLKQNELKKALYYFERAIKAPVRSEQLYADNHLKAEAEQAYRKLLRSNSDTDKNLIASSRDYTHNILPQ
ncbi:MAG: tetratricopeptide repeat protein, partial [Gammaproteobacteria bacterium]